MLTVVAQDLDMPAQSQHVAAQVMLEAVEVVRTVQLPTIDPADEERECVLVQIGKRELLGSRLGVEREELPEEGNFGGQEFDVRIESLVARAGVERRDVLDVRNRVLVRVHG